MRLFLEYIQWWYGFGLIRLLKNLKAFIIVLFDTFSVKICVRTFFAAWRKDVVSYEGLSLQERFGVWGFNLIARFFGMFIKTITLAIYLVCFVILLGFEILTLFIWLFLPMILIEGIVVGVLFLL